MLRYCKEHRVLSANVATLFDNDGPVGGSGLKCLGGRLFPDEQAGIGQLEIEQAGIEQQGWPMRAQLCGGEFDAPINEFPLLDQSAVQRGTGDCCHYRETWVQSLP